MLDATLQHRPSRFAARLAWAFALTVLPAVALVVLAGLEYRELRQQIAADAQVVAFVDAVQEARRHEKNELLGQDPDAATAWLAEVARAARLAQDPVVGRLDAATAPLVAAYAASVAGERREAGHALTTHAAALSARHNQEQVDRLDRIGRLLTAAAVGGILVLVLGGALVVGRLLRPLRRLEAHIHRIGEGDLSPIGVPLGDGELDAVRATLDRTLLRIRAREDLLVRSERQAAMGGLVFSVAHELGNPLGNIALAQGTLAEDWRSQDPVQVDATLAEIGAEASRARAILRSVLDVGRPGPRTTSPLAETVRDTLRLVRADLPPTARIDVAIAEDVVLMADRGQVQQVLINLLRNAAAAIGAGGQVRITAQREADRLLLSVADDGIGMEPAVVARLGEPFHTTKPTGLGHGLGLYTVHRIAAAHDGSVSVVSAPGRGTTVTVAFGGQP